MSSKKVPIVFSIEDQPYCKSFSESATHLPLALQSLFDPVHLEHNYVELIKAGENLHGILDVTPLQQSHLEKLTHDQARSRLWMRYSSGRITASRLYQAVHTDPHKPALSLMRSICYPESAKFTTTATQYGCEHEHKAVDAYKLKQLQLHQELKIKYMHPKIHAYIALMIFLNQARAAAGARLVYRNHFCADVRVCVSVCPSPRR